MSQHEFKTWQISICYQYNLINLLGSPFRTDGVNASAVRYFGRWIGIETQGSFARGNTAQTTNPPNLKAQSWLVAAGPRLAFRNRSRFEPWAHLVVGIQELRFSQNTGLLGDNSAHVGAAGGGVDFYLNPKLAVRAGADAIGSQYFSTTQRHFQETAGLVLNF